MREYYQRRKGSAADFPHLLSQHGSPPKVIWLTCGNTSNAKLREILSKSLPQALTFLQGTESLVEICGLDKSGTP
ncbi:MAG: DUF5615 family PIN-like protein [bacterium]